MLPRGIIILLLFTLVFGGAAAHSAPIPAAYQLTTMHVADAIEQTLEGEGVAENIRVEVIGASDTVLFESSTAAHPQLSGLVYDEKSGRWHASLLVTQSGKVATAIPVGGRFYEVVTLPILKRQLRKGDIVAEEDIDYEEFRAARIPSGTLRSGAELVGLSPRTTISAKRPVRENELTQPAVVKKNSLVQMIYRQGNMEIVTHGQAMNDAAPGELVQVRNMTSKSVVQAVVHNARTVIIEPLATQLSRVEGQKYAHNQ